MKRLGRIFGISIITMLYCFAISIVNIKVDNLSFDKLPSIEQLSCFSLFKTNLYCANSQTEESVNTSNENTVTLLKDRFNKFTVVIENKGRFIESSFAQYYSFSRNLLIRYRKCNFLFPFHYFW